MTKFQALVEAELQRARNKHLKGHNSFHEAYAVILEELEEFWEEVRKQSTARSRNAMFEELVQIGAMAQRAAEDLLEDVLAEKYHPHNR